MKIQKRKQKSLKRKKVIVIIRYNIGSTFKICKKSRLIITLEVTIDLSQEY